MTDNREIIFEAPKQNENVNVALSGSESLVQMEGDVLVIPIDNAWVSDDGNRLVLFDNSTRESEDITNVSTAFGRSTQYPDSVSVMEKLGAQMAWFTKENMSLDEIVDRLNEGDLQLVVTGELFNGNFARAFKFEPRTDC